MSNPSGDPMLIYATAIALDGHAVLLRGFSGTGKSDLGLRLIDAGGRLVADDQCEIHPRDGTLMVRAPLALAGLIEVRGLGIVRLDAMPEAPLALIADLVPSNLIERMPMRRSERILGVTVPVTAIAPFEASAPAKLRIALAALTGLGPVALLAD
ncbi:MAG TPA: HPr kinase/phosphatase C-terminal domain-containing protein [Stellaceae bacterium]|jgi:serine kinase of HPr protein (carbohydrate metabolism regulator)|nr:HPr kinase/phosphatase C-terminal domain-containing protein [Stellaceae bacterium]